MFSCIKRILYTILVPIALVTAIILHGVYGNIYFDIPQTMLIIAMTTNARIMSSVFLFTLGTAYDLSHNMPIGITFLTLTINKKLFTKYLKKAGINPLGGIITYITSFNVIKELFIHIVTDLMHNKTHSLRQSLIYISINTLFCGIYLFQRLKQEPSGITAISTEHINQRYGN